jgi:putative oxidoreductase
MNFESLSRYAPMALALLRIVAALLFIEHGTQKFFDFPPSGHGGSFPSGLFLVAAIIELVGGILLLIGLFTRPAAFIMSGEMAVAYWMAHVGRGGFWPINNGGETAILFCFVFLYLFFAGPGAWSVDGSRSARIS